MTIDKVLTEAMNYLTDNIAVRIAAQGHTLTGEYERSISGKIKVTKDGGALDGLAVDYGKYAEYGFPKTSASWKQWPFLVAYFIQRGFPIDSPNSKVLSAKNLAAMTIQKWMKEGMSTKASAAYSHTETKSRQHAILEVWELKGAKVDAIVESGLDEMVEEMFQKEKSETI